MGCKNVEPTINAKDNSSGNNRYNSKVKINSKCFVDKYYNDTDLIFFPILKLNLDGSLQNNFIQEISEDGKNMNFSSENNFPNILNYLANNLTKKFRFNKGYKVNALPLALDKAYFLKFYYNKREHYNNDYTIYLKGTIEYFNSYSKTKILSDVWVCELFIKFNKHIDFDHAMKISLKKMMSYAFENINITEEFHLLDI